MAYTIFTTDGSELKHNGDTVLASDVMDAVIKGVDLEKRELHLIGSTESMDRDGDIVSAAGVDLENFSKNPVFLWAHDHRGVPLAAASKVIRRKSPARIEFVERFPTKVGVYPFADMILELYADKIIRAASVGFIPKLWEDIAPEPPPTPGTVQPGMDNAPINPGMPDMSWRRGRKFTKVELLELSGVPIPSNPEAVVAALQEYKRFKSMDRGQQDWFIELLQRKEPIEPKEIDIVREQIYLLTKNGLEIEDEFAPTQVFISKTESQPPDLQSDEAPAAQDPVVNQTYTITLGVAAGANAEIPAVAASEKPGEAIVKEGQVLNAKNKALLKEAQANIQSVLVSAEQPKDLENPTEHKEYWETVLNPDAVVVRSGSSKPMQPTPAAVSGTGNQQRLAELRISPEEDNAIRSLVDSVRRQIKR